MVDSKAVWNGPRADDKPTIRVEKAEGETNGPENRCFVAVSGGGEAGIVGGRRDGRSSVEETCVCVCECCASRQLPGEGSDERRQRRERVMSALGPPLQGFPDLSTPRDTFPPSEATKFEGQAVVWIYIALVDTSFCLSTKNHRRSAVTLRSGERLRTASGSARGAAPHGERLRTASGSARGAAPHGERLRTGSGSARGAAPHGERLRTGSGSARRAAPHGERLRTASGSARGAAPHGERLRTASGSARGAAPHGEPRIATAAMLRGLQHLMERRFVFGA